MSALDRFDRDFARSLADLAEPRTPDYIDDVIQRAVRRRQRPAATFPARWLPMGVLAHRPAFAPGLPWRAIGLLIILALLLAAVFAIGLGALLDRPAPPYGIAANGQIAYSIDEDIYARDINTGEETLLVGGPASDFAPVFSRDGTRFAFVRAISQGQEANTISVMVANADGSNVHAVVEPVPAGDVHWIEWSPRGERLIFHNSAEGVPPLSVIDVDGEPNRRAIDLPLDVLTFDWRPGSDELILSGTERAAAPDPALGFYAIGVDGTGLRQLVPPAPTGFHEESFVLSHDGKFLAYSTAAYEERSDWYRSIHILDLETGGDRTLPGPDSQGGPVFSPDGQKLAFIRYSDAGQDEITAQAFVGSAFGDGTDALAVGPAVRVSPPSHLLARFSPDGTSLVVWKTWRGPLLRCFCGNDEAWLVDVATGAHERIPLGDDEWVTWQRLTP